MKRSAVKNVMSIYVPAFFITTGMSIVSPILSIYAKSFDVSYTMASLAISIYAVGRLCADLPVGLIGDRVGRRPVLLAGALTVTVSAFFCAFIESFGALVFFRLVQGIGASMWQTMRATMLQDILKPEERGKILGYFQAFTLIGRSAGPTIGGVVAEIWGIRAPFLAYGVGGFVCLVLSYLLIAEPEQADRHHTSQPNRNTGYSWAFIRRLFGNPSYFSACIATFAIMIMRTGLRSSLIPLYGNVELNLSTAEIGYALSFSTFSTLFIVIPIGYALDHFGRKSILVTSIVTSAITSALFSFSQNFVHLSLICVIFGLTTGSGGQAPLTLASDATIHEPHGLSMGLYRVFSDVGSIIGPMLVGAIADVYGLRIPFYVLAILMGGFATFVQLYAQETLTRHKT